MLFCGPILIEPTTPQGRFRQPQIKLAFFGVPNPARFRVERGVYLVTKLEAFDYHLEDGSDWKCPQILLRVESQGRRP